MRVAWRLNEQWLLGGDAILTIKRIIQEAALTPSPSKLGVSLLSSY
jgi:hypothetical protein